MIGMARSVTCPQPEPLDPLHWEPIEVEVELWAKAGKTPQFWWRDDDARRPSASLSRLLSISSNHQVPVTLAVIPDVDLTELAAEIRDRTLVSVSQHGCEHVNHNKGGGFQAEFAADRPAREVAATLNDAWRRLSQAMDAVPLYVPPWNNLTANVWQALAETPLRAVSRFGPVQHPVEGPAEINVHFNIAEWGPPRFRGAKPILERVARELRIRRREGRWTEPIGLITHHKNNDAESWAFLEAFFDRAAGPGLGFEWRAIWQLME